MQQLGALYRPHLLDFWACSFRSYRGPNTLHCTLLMPQYQDSKRILLFFKALTENHRFLHIGITALLLHTHTHRHRHRHRHRQRHRHRHRHTHTHQHTHIHTNTHIPTHTCTHIHIHTHTHTHIHTHTHTHTITAYRLTGIAWVVQTKCNKKRYMPRLPALNLGTSLLCFLWYKNIISECRCVLV